MSARKPRKLHEFVFKSSRNLSCWKFNRAYRVSYFYRVLTRAQRRGESPCQTTLLRRVSKIKLVLVTLSRVSPCVSRRKFVRDGSRRYRSRVRSKKFLRTYLLYCNRIILINKPYHRDPIMYVRLYHITA